MEFLQLQLNKVPIPFHFFTTKNIKFILSYHTTFDRYKLPDKSQAFSLKDAQKQIAKLTEMDVKDLDNLPWHLWEEAMLNLILFHASRFQEGPQSLLVLELQNLADFFCNKAGLFDYYPYWREEESELRSKVLEGKKVKDETLRAAWERVLTAVKLDKRDGRPAPPQPLLSTTAPLTLAVPTLFPPAPFPPSSRNQIQEGKPRAGLTSLQPFPSGSKGQLPFGPCCIGCGKRGHTLHEHRPEHGPLIWAVRIGGKLYSRQTLFP
ncbi:hypothetical protein FB446DRAFT_814265 [Lentinula raphanica]|nr:hypothetical protein FB446DRAFT_814265 [Lentinula raphanica]